MNIVLTGASKGIGKYVAGYLLAENHNVVGIARDGSLLENISKNSKEGKFFPVQFDLEKMQGNEEMLLKKISDCIPTVDILINNAGTLTKETFLNSTWEQIQQQFMVNIFSPAALIRLLIPMMKKNQQAHVLNIGSMAGFQGSKKFPGIAFYSASKAALSCLTECLAEEFKNLSISFNCLALGGVQTEMFTNAFPDVKAPLNPAAAGAYIADFALNGHQFYNGKILAVSIATP
jgi:short-subunit dehydrogenase